MTTLTQATLLVVVKNTPQKDATQLFLEHKSIDLKAVTWLNEVGESIKIESIRELKQQLIYSIEKATHRYLVLLHSEKMTLSAQNALLKTLEEPPTQTSLILVTDEPRKLLDTILSRTQVAYTLNNQSAEMDESSKNDVAIYDTIATTSYGELMLFIERFASAEDALVFLNNLIHFIYQKYLNNSQIDTFNEKTINKINKASKHILLLQESVKHIEGNANYKLCMEDTLFKVKQSI